MGKVKELIIDTEDREKRNYIMPEIGPEDLARAIHFHRKKTNLSQAELAKLAGVGKTVVFDVEKGKTTVRLDTLQKILAVLNIKMIFRSPLMHSFLGRSK